MIQLTVPGIPPSANHYKGLNRRTGRFYVRKPAIGFKADVAVFLAGRVMPRRRLTRLRLSCTCQKASAAMLTTSTK